MIFNPFTFVPIYSVILLVYFVLPKNWRWAWLLIAGYLFFATYNLKYAAILLVCTSIAYLTGLLVENNQDKKSRKNWMVTGIALIAGMLFLFKYLSFFFDSLNSLLAAIGARWSLPGFEILMPIGVSFYTLQAIGYILDVYNGKIEAEKNFGYFALFISFFPKLLIGPIERYKGLMPQLINPLPAAYERIVENLLRVGWGLFKKMVVADRLAVLANTVFNTPKDFSAPQLVIATLAFSFQIYVDFSAYSDIAIGTAKVMGIHLTENFNAPYMATSVIDFWRRWHISFSNWLRDYIFLPLNYKHARNAPRKLWTALDVMIVFLVSGLWHGANWTFILWGAVHGLFQSIEILTQDLRDRFVKKFGINRSSFPHRSLQILTTFSLVSFSWVFFRANTVHDAGLILGVFSKGVVDTSVGWLMDGSMGLDLYDMWAMIITLFLVFIVEAVSRKHNLAEYLAKKPTWIRWLVYLLLFFSITIFGVYGEIDPVDFVYAQF